MFIFATGFFHEVASSFFSANLGESVILQNADNVHAMKLINEKEVPP